jgi:hypothetical protein
MPVSGRELASLDFANLIGGPLNAIVEAQAKSAITTTNFIKEVAFDKEGKVVNIDFTYNRKNDDGRDQKFTLTVPFLTMLPVPYITISSAVVEFNAKITSINESNAEDNFSQQLDAEVGGNYWFISAKLQSKTSYQRKTATSEKEERTFDMHVRVEAKNEDMPAGTERLLTILENSIGEKKGPELIIFKFTHQDNASKEVTVETDLSDLSSLNTCTFKAKVLDSAGKEVEKDVTITVDNNKKVTLNENLCESELNKVHEIAKPVKKA